MDEPQHGPIVTSDGRLDLDALEAALTVGDVAMGALTEEELYWFGPAAGRPIPDAPDLQTLRELDHDSAVARLDSVAAMLQARGELLIDGDDPPRLGRTGPRAMLGQLRGTATARTIVQASRSAELIGIVHHLPMEADLLQRPVAPGIHDFVCTTRERAAHWLAVILDPDGLAAVTGDLVRVQDRDDLQPTRAELEAADHVNVLTRLHRGGPELRTAEVVAGSAVGVVALRGYRDGEASEYVAQSLTSTDLQRFCSAFLHAKELPGDLLFSAGR